MTISFKNFLNEADFSEENFARLLSAFETRMPKLLGTEVYRSGGAIGSERVGGATGYLYFFNDSAFRVRASGGSILGIDVWDTFHINIGPSYYIDVSTLDASSILGAFSKIAKIIANPATGDIPVNGVSEMARRTDANSFYDMARSMYGDDQVQRLTWAQIKDVADKNDVLIPPYVRSQKVGRGTWNVIPGASGDGGKGDMAHINAADDGDETPSAPGTDPELAGSSVTKIGGDGKKDSILYIKVTAQDPDSKKFISAANDARAQKLYADIQKSLDTPTEAEVKDPETMYGHMAQLVAMACSGKLRSLLIYGGPGTGKTFTIMKTVKEQGLVPGTDYVKLSGKASAISIYETLFMYRKGGLVIFDDLDSMWGNPDATNILKAALDTSPVREISWSSAATINVAKMSDEKKEALFAQIDRQINGEDDMPEDDEEDDGDDEDTPKKKRRAAVSSKPDKIKFPSTFEFTGRVIFISNLKKDEFDTAIMSRSAKIGMDMSAAQILQRMRTILPMLGGDDVSVEKKEELLDQLLLMHKRKEITAVTMREFTKGLDIVRSGAPNWRDLVQYA